MFHAEVSANGLFQNNQCVITLGLFSDGAYLDPSTLSDAKYYINAHCQDKIEKSISAGTLSIITVGSGKLIQCTLTASETENLSGQIVHQLQIAQSPSVLSGVTLSQPKLKFISTEY